VSGHPYSPQTLADRWGCSAEKIRRMYRAGEIGGFELGKLIRIPAAEVERFECQSTHSPNTGESGLSPSMMESDGAESRLARMTESALSPSPAKFGSASPRHEANG